MRVASQTHSLLHILIVASLSGCTSQDQDSELPTDSGPTLSDEQCQDLAGADLSGYFAALCDAWVVCFPSDFPTTEECTSFFDVEYMDCTANSCHIDDCLATGYFSDVDCEAVVPDECRFILECPDT